MRAARTCLGLSSPPAFWLGRRARPSAPSAPSWGVRALAGFPGAHIHGSNRAATLWVCLGAWGGVAPGGSWRQRRADAALVCGAGSSNKVAFVQGIVPYLVPVATTFRRRQQERPSSPKSAQTQQACEASRHRQSGCFLKPAGPAQRRATKRGCSSGVACSGAPRCRRAWPPQA